MKRQIITIDKEKCNGCGLCVNACHEGAIALEGGKAVLVRDDYCDGLGNCLPACPTGAITFEEREAAAYDEEAVRRNMAAREAVKAEVREETPCGCPGTRARLLARSPAGASAGRLSPAPAPVAGGSASAAGSPSAGAASGTGAESELTQWPVQIKLVPVRAPWFNGANLLIAADCSAYAYAAFHRDFIRNHITIIGCPKLDQGDYTEKLTAILTENDIKSLTIVRMEVPCCGGLAHAATEALRASGKFIPWQVVTISTDGKKL